MLADAGYGLSGPFRQALTERSLTGAVGIPYKQKVYPADVAMIFPISGRGHLRKNHVPDIASRPAQDVLEGAKWQTVSWRRDTKGKLSRALLSCACGWLTARRSGLVILARSIFPAKRYGWSASSAPPARANAASAICPPARRPGTCPAPSRRAGSARQPINN
ncbi:transposase [Novosphingobium sp. TW-4]|uniref:Transposase n=1 Tax=Novosphingobium olei TaxID=2728851 RepID=A0A7Y0GD21_9SPHN|nr:transposase [Novosphingobium olei]